MPPLPGKAIIMVTPQVAKFKGDLTVLMTKEKKKIAATIHPIALPTQLGIAIRERKRKKVGLYHPTEGSGMRSGILGTQLWLGSYVPLQGCRW